MSVVFVHGTGGGCLEGLISVCSFLSETLPEVRIAMISSLVAGLFAFVTFGTSSLFEVAGTTHTCPQTVADLARKMRQRYEY
jgi:hypothetical protein